MDKIREMLSEAGIPFAYDHFAENEAPDLPYMVYRIPGSNNFAADGKVYHKSNVLEIELYTEDKDPETEETIESILTLHEMYFDKTEEYISEEKMYQIVYETEV